MNESADSQRVLGQEEHTSYDPAHERKKQLVREVMLDRSLEALPVFRLSDSAEGSEFTYSPASGGRWRVIAHPGDRLPGTFDQDVYVEILRRFHDASSPNDGAVSFTLHSFLRSIGRRADGRTYEQLRASLTRLEHTVLESNMAYYDAGLQSAVDMTFTLLSSVSIRRRREAERDQFALFPVISSSEPGVARVAISPCLRNNLNAGHSVTLEIGTYLSLQSAVARRLYRLLGAVRAMDQDAVWRISVGDLARMLPLSQRYPSHLLRVLHPAHEMLIAAGLLGGVGVTQTGESWGLEYDLSATSSYQPFSAAGGKDLA